MKKKENKYHQLCVWPSTIVDRDDINELKQFFNKSPVFQFTITMSSKFNIIKLFQLTRSILQ